MNINVTAPTFQPFTLTVETPQELASLVGALGAYGKGKTKAKKTIREVGLEDFYSGNVRKDARNFVSQIVEALDLDEPDFSGPFLR